MATSDFALNAEPRRYLICHEEQEFSAGCTADGLQVLMGLLYPNVVGVFFDSEGRFLRLEARKVPVAAPLHPTGVAYLLDDLPFQASFQTVFEDWKQSIGFSPGTISVQKFFIESEYLGIKDRPEHQQAFLDDPDELDRIAEDQEEKRDYLEDIARWEREQMFVLWWAKDFWMTREGEIEST